MVCPLPIPSKCDSSFSDCNILLLFTWLEWMPVTRKIELLNFLPTTIISSSVCLCLVSWLLANLPPFWLCQTWVSIHFKATIRYKSVSLFVSYSQKMITLEGLDKMRKNGLLKCRAGNQSCMVPREASWRRCVSGMGVIVPVTSHWTMTLTWKPPLMRLKSDIIPLSLLKKNSI